MKNRIDMLNDKARALILTGLYNKNIYAPQIETYELKKKTNKNIPDVICKIKNGDLYYFTYKRNDVFRQLTINVFKDRMTLHMSKRKEQTSEYLFFSVEYNTRNDVINIEYKNKEGKNISNEVRETCNTAGYDYCNPLSWPDDVWLLVALEHD